MVALVGIDKMTGVAMVWIELVLIRTLQRTVGGIIEVTLIGIIAIKEIAVMMSP